MSTWLIVVLYIVAILTIVLIHETGHFIFAKAFKIKVEEFFVGFGPRLWSTRRGETEYGLKALPFGGYVRIAGMNPFQETPEEDLPRAFGAKPAWQRAVVIGAGPVTHFVMAFLLIAVFFMGIGTPSRFRPEIEAVQTTLNGHPGPAFQAGLRPGDQVIAVDGNPVPVSSDPARALVPFRSYTRNHPGVPITVKVVRDGRIVSVEVTPIEATVAGQSGGYIGVEVGPATVARHRLGPITAFRLGAVGTWDTAKGVVQNLGRVFGPSGLKRLGELLVGAKQRTQGDVQSVVGGGQMVVQAARTQAWDLLLGILVSFNVFIGILNLIPLPPLDGGHLAVIA
jgi:membrane-associated protease RseP (regulator of RpoE activity)